MNSSSVTRWGRVRTRRFEPVCALTFLVTLLLACSVGLSIAQDEKKETAAQLADRYRNSSHERYCGARLTIKASVGKDDGITQQVRIDWSIDYTGKRHPFTIWKPSFERPTKGQTRLYVFYPRPTGEGDATFIEAPSPVADAPEVKDHFALANDGKSIGGDVVLLFGKVNPETLRGRRPERFAKGTTIYMRLAHAPTERGADLDAWTGHLMSNIVELKFE